MLSEFDIKIHKLMDRRQLYSFLIFGEKAVGKSQIINRFTTKGYTDSHMPNLDTFFATRKFKLVTGEEI